MEVAIDLVNILCFSLVGLIVFLIVKSIIND
jgi:hypothetical protein